MNSSPARSPAPPVRFLHQVPEGRLLIAQREDAHKPFMVHPERPGQLCHGEPSAHMRNRQAPFGAYMRILLSARGPQRAARCAVPQGNTSIARDALRA